MTWVLRFNRQLMLPGNGGADFTRGVRGTPGFVEVYAVHGDPAKGWVGRALHADPEPIWTPVRPTKELASLHLEFLIRERRLLVSVPEPTQGSRRR